MRCAELEAAVTAKDRVIADQARTLERVTAELRWHGLDDAALTVGAGYALYERARQGDRSWRKYRALLAPAVRLLGALPCLQVTPERWAEHRAQRLTETCGRYGHLARPSSSHLDQELGLAKMLLHWLVRAGHLPRNPLDLARKVNEPSGRETCLSDADVQRLAAGADCLLTDGRGHENPRRVLLFRAWLLAKYGTGTRFNEARTLRRDRIGAGGIVELSARATKGKQRRTVALTAAAIAAVGKLPQLGTDPRVFTVESKRGRVSLVGENTLRTWFHLVCARTGIDARAVEGERVVPHVLRHSAASHLEAQGATPFQVRDFLGHKTVATTERYLHRQQAENAVVMAGLMEGRKGPRRAGRKKGVDTFPSVG